MRTLSHIPIYKISKSINAYGKKVWMYKLPYILNNLPKIHADLLKKTLQIKNILKGFYMGEQYSWERYITKPII